MVVDQLATVREIGSSVVIIYSMHGALTRELGGLLAGDKRIAVMTPADWDEIVNAEDSKTTFSRFLGARIDVASIAPYAPRNGVDNARAFFGRGEVLRRVMNGGRANYVFYGGRRMGKTALLQAIERRSPPGHRTLRVQLSNERLMPELAAPLGLPADAGIEAILGGLRSQEYRLVLIDEADQFIQHESETQFQILRQLRGFSANHPCNFVITGFWRVFRSCTRDYLSPLLNFGEDMRVGPLERDAALGLVTKPMVDLGARYDTEKTPHDLVEMTGARANLLARACLELLRHVGVREPITAGHVADVLHGDAFGLDLEAWKNLSGSDDAGPAVARANHIDRIAIHLTIADPSFSLEDLVELFRRARVSVRREELRDALDRLELEYILGANHGRYRYTVPMFRARILGKARRSLLRRSWIIPTNASDSECLLVRRPRAKRAQSPFASAKADRETGQKCGRTSGGRN